MTLPLVMLMRANVEEPNGPVPDPLVRTISTPPPVVGARTFVLAPETQKPMQFASPPSIKYVPVGKVVVPPLILIEQYAVPATGAPVHVTQLPPGLVGIVIVGESVAVFLLIEDAGS